MNNLEKILDRVRKLLKLAENTPSEAEASNAAAQASKLMEEYELTEALVRLEDPGYKAEPIVSERLDPDKVVDNSKRVAWKETIARAVAEDLGIHMYWFNSHVGGRMRADIRGLGRKSAIQTWRYTWQYLCTMVNEFAEKAWDSHQFKGDAYEQSARAWKNAFRVACATRLAIRLYEKRSEAEILRQQAKAAALGKDAQALTLVEKDREEVTAAYQELKKGFGKPISSIGQVTSADGYAAGRRAGDQISLGGAKAALS